MGISFFSEGLTVIKTVQKTLADKPGVYRMLGANGNVLYVGKAHSLKKRVLSYTHLDRLPMRLKRMVAETRSMEIIETHTELEALLLEFNLIKELNPVYNVLLKDDKMFPYILITGNHPYPRIMKHRGQKTIKGTYFGPFATVGAVGNTLNSLQKIFQTRNCTDHFFESRKRPCLQYHIKRCTAPCVGYVSQDDYNKQIVNAVDFLNGKTPHIQDRFASMMREASDREEYEKAASYRDRIRALASIQASQTINTRHIKNADVFAVVQDSGFTCISVFFIRHGHNFGNKTMFPKIAEDEDIKNLLTHFINHFYTDNPVTPKIIINVLPHDSHLLTEALTIRLGHNVTITKPQRGEKLTLIQMAEDNARSALLRYKAQKFSNKEGLERITELFRLDNVPQRIEVYDNSHTGGTNMVGAMIVAGSEGFHKSAYRKFNIREAKASDDYGMMREVMKRRFSSTTKEDEIIHDKNWPDLLIIDGGIGQLHAVTDTLSDLGVIDNVTVVSIAKGPDRNAGREDFYMMDRAPFRLPPNDIGLFYLQRLRDEAHRFAISSMRIRRNKAMSTSPIDAIPGIGSKRKKALLTHFGSGKAVSRAAIADLEKVEGISKVFAQKIYGYFHG